MKGKVLFVDDDLSILHLYEEEFSEEGYEVLLARNGKEALVKLKEESPDLVVMDICMPEKEGIETLNAMLQIGQRIPIILNTDYLKYRDNFMTWGAEAYVLKSSDLTELKRKVREILEKRKRSEIQNDQRPNLRNDG
jgi:DNA-binding NtrC family response regulator